MTRQINGFNPEIRFEDRNQQPWMGILCRKAKALNSGDRKENKKGTERIPAPWSNYKESMK